MFTLWQKTSRGWRSERQRRSPLQEPPEEVPPIQWQKKRERQPETLLGSVFDTKMKAHLESLKCLSTFREGETATNRLFVAATPNTRLAGVAVREAEAEPVTGTTRGGSTHTVAKEKRTSTRDRQGSHKDTL